MNIKHWTLTLALGAVALGVSSCKDSKKDSPVNPTPNPVVPTPDPNADKSPEALRGTWKLSDITVSPATVTIDGQQVAVKDHIFDIVILGQMGTPTQLLVEKGVATFSGAKADKTFAPTIDSEGNLKYRSFPIGKLTAEGGKLHATIQVANALLKQMPSFSGNPADGKQNVSQAERIFQTIAQGSEDLKITLVGTK